MKEPWLAVILSYMFPGAGQIYVGRKTRGVLFLVIFLVFSVISKLLMFDFSRDALLDILPDAFLNWGWALGLILILLTMLAGIFHIYVLFDAYFISKKKNKEQSAVIPQQKKQPYLAMFLSLMLLVGGQFYNGQILKGIAYICLLFFGIFTNIPLTRMLGGVGDFVGSGVFQVILIFVALDAYRSALEINGENGSVFSKWSKKRVWGIAVIWVLFSFMLGQADNLMFEKITNKYQSFKNASTAMQPALNLGEQVLVNKQIYQGENPKRGDVIAFRFPLYPGKIFIRRIAGLPGETLKVTEEGLHVNGQLLLDANIRLPQFSSGQPKWEYGKIGQEFQVPENAYFVLSDNYSAEEPLDSRVMGFVPRKEIQGKVTGVYWPLNHLRKTVQ